jgi:hypothetical protein
VLGGVLGGPLGTGAMNFISVSVLAHQASYSVFPVTKHAFSSLAALWDCSPHTSLVQCCALYEDWAGQPEGVRT